MPGTPIDELLRHLALMQNQGLRTAWLDPKQAKAFFQSPMGGATPQRPTESPQPTGSQWPAATAATVSPTTGGGAANPLPSFRQAFSAQTMAATPPPQTTTTAPAATTPTAATLHQSLQQIAPQQLTNNPPQTPPPNAAAISQMDWSGLEAAIHGCGACRLCQTRHHVVMEDGCRQARIMFIGEGPGEEEDRQGVPFVGRAGQLLTRMITAMHLDRSCPDKTKGVYIANIVKCRPPNNRNPEMDEAAACVPFLHRQIELVQPEVIVLLGAVPLLHLLDLKGITRLRGTWQSYRGIPVMPTFHPAYLLRFERDEKRFREEKLKVWDDLKKVMQLLS